MSRKRWAMPRNSGRSDARDSQRGGTSEFIGRDSLTGKDLQDYAVSDGAVQVVGFAAAETSLFLATKAGCG